jgi:hypothetical protein
VVSAYHALHRRTVAVFKAWELIKFARFTAMFMVCDSSDSRTPTLTTNDGWTNAYFGIFRPAGDPIWLYGAEQPWVDLLNLLRSYY